MSEYTAAQIPKPSDEQTFERCNEILWRCILRDDTVQLHGRRGQEQHGVDLTGLRDDQPERSGEPAFHDSACSRIVSSAASRNVGKECSSAASTWINSFGSSTGIISGVALGFKTDIGARIEVEYFRSGMLLVQNSGIVLER